MIDFILGFLVGALVTHTAPELITKFWEWLKQVFK
jgi:hypothetical protein